MSQVEWNIIKYAITDREMERPSKKEKRPHFLFIYARLKTDIGKSCISQIEGMRTVGKI